MLLFTFGTIILGFTLWILIEAGNMMLNNKWETIGMGNMLPEEASKK